MVKRVVSERRAQSLIPKDHDGYPKPLTCGFRGCTAAATSVWTIYAGVREDREFWCCGGCATLLYFATRKAGSRLHVGDLTSAEIAAGLC